jgi:hypothetical protein
MWRHLKQTYKANILSFNYPTIHFISATTRLHGVKPFCFVLFPVPAAAKAPISCQASLDL